MKIQFQKLAVHVPIGVVVLDPLIFNVGGKALIQPKVIPPTYCHKVTKPPEMAKNVIGNLNNGFLNLTDGPIRD